jgi:hypothetical protein
MMNIESANPESAAHSFLRFCWLRETTPGHLEHDAGVRIAQCDLLLALFGLHRAQQRTTAEPPVSLGQTLAYLAGEIPFEAFPVWARRRLVIMVGPMATEEMRIVARCHGAVLMDVARRILAAIPAGRQCEVHLPYIDRRAWPRRFEILQNCDFVFYQGRTIPATLLQPGRMAEYDAQLLAVSSLADNMAAALSFVHSQQTIPALRNHLLPVPANPEPPSAGSTEQVETRLDLEPAACRAWKSAPREKDGSYFTVHAAVSIAVQAALRRWLAWHWLSNLANYEDTPGTYTVLAYLCTRPFPGRRRTDYTYDTLTTDWMPFAFRFARRPLRCLLKKIHGVLLAAGNKMLARKYHPSNAKFILERVRKQRKAIRSVMAGEGAIVNYVLKCGLELQAATDPIRAAHLAPEFVRGLAVRLRRLFQEQDLTDLATMLLLEATDAVAVSQGDEPSLTSAVTIPSASGAGQFAATAAPHSFAVESQQVPFAA